MKRLLNLVIILVATVTAWATPVSEQQARQLAAQFVSQRIAAARGSQVPSPQLAMKQAKGHFFVYNIGQKDGFVVVSGDDRTPAILAYSTGGDFNEQEMPENMRAWLQGYADQLEYASTHSNAIAPLARTARQAIDPLVTTTWGQGAPYNNKCPIDPTTGERSVTGCAATAMAQVVAYHKSPARTTATIPAYLSEKRSIDIPDIEPTDLDWANMLDHYSSSATQAQQDAVATLMYLCGASIHMGYSSGTSSGTGDQVPPALVNYFGFDEHIFYANRNQYTTQSWENMIYNELAAQRPVFYSGQSAGGGHGFVVDGYDGNGLFHVNWGWDGGSDGYFLLSILNPYSNEGIGASSTDDGYSFIQQAIINARPADGTTPLAVAAMTTNAIAVQGDKTLTRQKDGNFLTSINAYIINVTKSTRTFYFGLGVFDSEDNFVDGTIYNQDELNHNYGWPSYNFENFSFGAGLSDGVYKIKVVSSDSDDMQTSIQNVKSNMYYIQAVISGNTCTLTEPFFDLSGTLTIDGSVKVNSPAYLNINLQNNGTDFGDDLYLIVDGKFVGGMYFEVAAGQSKDFNMEFKVKETGTKTLKLVRYVSNKYVTIAEKEMTVEDGYSELASNFTLLNADANDVVKEDKVSFSVTITNSGTANYGNLIATVLYNESDNVLKYNEASRTVKAGGSTTYQVEFSGLEDGTVYKLGLQYVKDGGYQRLLPYFVFSTNFTGDPDLQPNAKLSIDINIDDLDSSLEFPEIHANAVSGNVVLTNVGAMNYNNTIWVDLYKVDYSDEWPRIYSNEYKDVSINKNGSKTINFSFDNLDDEELYYIVVSYMKNEKEEGYKLADFTTNYAAEGEPLLTTIFSFDDVDEKFILNSSTLNGSATVKNIGEGTYDGPLELKIFKWGESLENWTDLTEKTMKQTVTLAPNESTTLNFSFDGLENENDYCLMMLFMKGTNWGHTDSGYFYVQLTQTAITELAGADAEVAVYSISGQLVAKLPKSKAAQLLRKQPKGIYIVGGKKVMN